uniref:Uncharacterized protein n=1 Tax=viral metagenome TaxID=1070528 RepID=A0A6C0AFB6_9ZZZZ
MVKQECCKKCGSITEYSYYYSMRFAEPCSCEKFDISNIKKITGEDTFMARELKSNPRPLKK